MSRYPQGPLIPGSTDFDTNYTRMINIGSLSDGILSIRGGTIRDLIDPVEESDAANKGYVDSIIGGDPLVLHNVVADSIICPLITGLISPTSSTQAANKAYVDSRIVSNFTEFLVQVQKDPGAGEFATIESALASITDASLTRPYCVSVGPGIYDENELVIPSYVSVKGASILTTIIRPVIPNQHVFVMSNTTEVSFMTLQGISGSVSPGPGAGYSAIYAEDIGEYALTHKISMYDFDIFIENYSNVADSSLYIEYTDINGNYSYGTINRSNVVPNGSIAKLSLENFFSFPCETCTVIVNDGNDTLLEIDTSSLTGTTGMSGIVSRNGGSLNISAVVFSNFSSTAIISENVGLGATIRINSCSLNNCTLDFDILNADTSGYFFGNSPKNNHNIVSGSSFFVASEDLNVVKVSKRGGDYTSIKDAVDSITTSTATNVFVVQIGPGIYIEDIITLKQGIILVGAALGSTVIIPTVSTNKIIIGADRTMIRDLSLIGASGVGGTAVYIEGTTGTGMLVRDCEINNNYIAGQAYGAVNPTVLWFDRCYIIGNTNTLFSATNTGTVSTRLILTRNTYQDTSLPVCTYFAYASGLGVELTCEGSIMRVISGSSATAFYVNDGADARIESCIIRGFDKILHVPSGSSNPSTVYIGSILYSDIATSVISIENVSTIGYWFGQTDYLKVSIPTNCPFFISGTDRTIITVQKSGGDFSSIATAVDSITDNSTVKRYVIQIGSGTFTEPQINMKPYILITGMGRATVILPDSSGHHIINGSDYSEINSCVISSAGTGYAAIYHESSIGTKNSSLIVRNIIFGNNSIQCWAYGNVGHANIIIFTSIFGGRGQFTYGFRATNNNNSVPATIKIMSSTSQDFLSPVPINVIYVSGTNCRIEANGMNISYKGTIEEDSTAVYLGNGGSVRLLSLNIEGFDTGIFVDNTGSAPDLISIGSTITNCTTDINVEHPDTTGSLDMTVNKSKVFIDTNAPLTVFFIDQDNTGIISEGPFYYAKTGFSNVTDIKNLIMDTPTMGVIFGGELSVSTGLIVAISAGIGYNNSELEIITYRSWSDSTLALAINSNLYIIINVNGTITSSASYPNNIENIVLGLVSTNGTNIIYIQKTPVIAHHWTDRATQMFKEAMGPIYASGSQVAEFGTRQLTVSQGRYYFTVNFFTPGGGSPITFNIYYRSAVAGIYTAIVNQLTVPNTSYDDGSGTLTPLTTGYFTKHLLLLLGGPSEVYVLIYGQEEYSSQGQAEAGSIPSVPSFVSDAFVNVASIVVQEGLTNIVSFIDERPRIGFASSSATGTITVHGDLLGLSANDHPQYLLVDGSAPGMEGDLNMNSNNIVDVALFNGFNVSAHASRHAFNGADPLSPALAINISEISDSVAFAGVNNTLIPRADHQHPHGNRSGGTLHISATTVTAGFMSASDKTKLDGIATGATVTPLTSQAPVNITKDTAVIGVGTSAARYDHKHDISTGIPITILLTTTTNAEGTATSLARSDHTHAISSTTAVQITPDLGNSTGNSTSFARADHIHNIPTGIAVSLDANSSSTQGAANTFSRSNHSHAIASGAPSNQTIAPITSIGTSINFARADHIHTFSTLSPTTIGITNVEGTSTSFSRADHVHSHGVQTDGYLHAVVISNGTSGFMTGPDKLKLDQIATGATNTPITNIAPIDVSKSTAVIGVSTSAARSDHKHDISTAIATGLLTSSTNTEGSATSLARSDHTHEIASGPPSNQTITSTTSTGVSINFARADHIHTFSTLSPTTIGITNVEGTSTSFARADHVHSHGAQTDGSLHALVISNSTSGFMSGADKLKLDNIESGATNTPLTNIAPTDVSKSTAVIGVSTSVARSDHKHDISTATATELSISSTNTEGSATSLARSDHTHAITFPPFADFGNASDGDVTISATTLISRSMYYNNLTVNNGTTLTTSGFKIFVAGTLLNNGTIDFSGNTGGNSPNTVSGGSAGIGGIGGTALIDGDLGGSLAGSNGGLGPSSGNTIGGTGISATTIVSQGGGNSVVAGLGGSATGGAGGPAGLGANIVDRRVNVAYPNLMSGSILLKGGASGPGGGSGGSGANNNSRASGGGGGGSGGGVMLIWANVFNNLGIISANGGNGGNSGNSAGTNAGTGGTGSGGGGGAIFIAYATLTNIGTVNVNGGTRGLTPGTPIGTGIAGSLGSNGTSGSVIKYNATTRSWS